MAVPHPACRSGKPMRRRAFLAGMAALWPPAARGQAPGRTYRVGLLSGGTPVSVVDERQKAMISGLASRGYVEGRNLVLEARWAEAHVDRLPALAAELIARSPDAIVTFGYPAGFAAKQASASVPIVLTGAGDPVATGLVQSLARPGGNVTGMTELSTELSAKRLQLIKEAVPNLMRVAMLWNAADLGMTLRTKAAEDAARVLGLQVQMLGVREPEDFEQAFAAMMRDRPGAILMVSDALTVLNRQRIVDFAVTNRLPTIFELTALVRDGGLMSYGANQAAIGERAADFLARIMGGARPADQPLEQPMRLELAINLKTASSLGLSLPQSLLVRADEIIE
jgi:putative tryptophan/tyrosine transport system substrate-binding protein